VDRSKTTIIFSIQIMHIKCWIVLVTYFPLSVIKYLWPTLSPVPIRNELKLELIWTANLKRSRYLNYDCSSHKSRDGVPPTGLGLDPWQRQRIFPAASVSRQTLRSTASYPMGTRGRDANHSPHLVPDQWVGAIMPPALSACMTSMAGEFLTPAVVGVNNC
jgi:hypothetical protein